MTTQESINLRTNSYYRQYKDYMYNLCFDELMLQMLIIKEGGGYYQSGILFLIKTLRDEIRKDEKNFVIGLRELKQFTDLLRDLRIIDVQNNYITDGIYEINSIKDVVYMIDNDLDIKTFSRYQKLHHIKSNIINKV